MFGIDLFALRVQVLSMWWPTAEEAKICQILLESACFFCHIIFRWKHSLKKIEYPVFVSLIAGSSFHIIGNTSLLFSTGQLEIKRKLKNRRPELIVTIWKYIIYGQVRKYFYRYNAYYTGTADHDRSSYMAIESIFHVLENNPHENNLDRLLQDVIYIADNGDKLI